MWNGWGWNPSIEAKAVCAHILNKRGYEPRDVQVEAIRAVMAGKDTLVVSGTGSGKSLIYQTLPELQEGGIVLVFCPLLSLMYDQVKSHQDHSINWDRLKKRPSMASRVLHSPRSKRKRTPVSGKRSEMATFNSFLPARRSCLRIVLVL
jgi:superfamily II DNA helicase RecQ